MDRRRLLRDYPESATASVPTGVKTWDDMMKRKEFILGTTAKGSGNYINGATLREVFNAPVRQILGFPGSAEQRIAHRARRARWRLRLLQQHSG